MGATLEIEREDAAAGAAGESAQVPLPRELRAFWIASLCAVLLAVVVGWAKWHAGESKYNWDPLSDDLFFDLMEYPGTYTLLHSQAFFSNVAGHPWAYPMWNPVAYPPFAVVVMAPMYAFFIPDLAYMVVAGLWLAFAVGWVRRALVRGGIAPWTATLLPVTLLAMSFPIWRMLHQGNIELLVWIFAALGAMAWMEERDGPAAVLWGLAAAMKLFPLVLVGLLLPRRSYRAFATGMATFVGATIASLWWIGPTMGAAWHGSLKNVFGYQGRRVVEWSGASLATNHSVMEMVKLAALVAHTSTAKMTLPYYACGAAAMALAVGKKLWRMPKANQLLAVTAFMLLFPTISYYHTLVHLYAPLTVLGWVAIQAQRAGVRVPGLEVAMLLFVPLFASFTVLNYPQVLVFCGVVQSLALLALFFVATEYPFAVEGQG